jgi:hypothetical protein
MEWGGGSISRSAINDQPWRENGGRAFDPIALATVETVYSYARIRFRTASPVRGYRFLKWKRRTCPPARCISTK